MPLAILCGCTAWFVWGLVGKPEDQFSHKEAHLIEGILKSILVRGYVPLKADDGHLFNKCYHIFRELSSFENNNGTLNCSARYLKLYDRELRPSVGLSILFKGSNKI